MPTNVSATLLMSSPETPKSQILICPAELRRILLGLTSAGELDSEKASCACARKEARVEDAPRCMILCTS